VNRRLIAGAARSVRRCAAGAQPAAVPVLGVALWLAATPALAACTDPAGPEVNWRRCYQDARNLVAVDLTGAQLRDATFQRSALDRATLAGADAYRAKFISATLTEAVFDGARLTESDFTSADLTGASLKDADLRNARFVGATMVGVDLSGARLGGAELRNADLSGATWVDGTRVCAEGSRGQCY
jgi:uncharacterized protein YjbI with pentapeptide repeats